MGQLADDIFYEVEKLESAYAEVCEELKATESKIDEFEVQVSELLRTVAEQDAYIKYAESCIEGLNTAYDVAQRIQETHEV